jgi:hypothetical protein
MMDANRVLAYHSQDAAAVAWDATRRSELYRVRHKSTWPMLLSSGGKYLVQHSGLWLRFFGAADGRHVGSLGPLSADYQGLAAVALSTDGQSIAATFRGPTGGSHTVAVFDAAQGSLKHEVEVPMAAGQLQWVGDQFLLAGYHLVSLAHERTVWDYSGLQPFLPAPDGRVWFAAAGGGETYLTAATLPSDDVVSKIDAYAAANTPILQTGDTVSLQVTASGRSPKDNLQQSLTETFRGKLTAAGYQVADNRPFRLQVAVTENDSGRQLEYRSFGAPRGNTLKVPNRKIVCNVAFVDSGDQEVWQVSTTMGPAFMSFNRGGGDPVTQLLAARWEKLDSWIEHMQITKMVRKFSSTGKFGKSLLEASGERILSVPTP